MSNSLTENLSDIEDGEIHSPPCSQKASDLEDLSSCEEMFSSDSRTSHSPRNNKHHSKVCRKDSHTASQRKETVVQAKSSAACKRRHASRRTSGKPTESRVTKKDRLRGVQRRERSISFSSEDDSVSLRRAGRCGKRLRRVKNKPKNSDTSLMNIIQKKKSELSINVTCSFPEKVQPKSSLKRRLMPMISLAASTNEVGNQGTLSQVDARSDTEPEATKKIISSDCISGNDLYQDKIPKKLKVTAISKIKVEQKVLLEQVDTMQHLPASEKVAVEVQQAEDQHNSSVTGDEDLAKLRKLALEALKKKVPVKVQPAAAASEESDDLTELRLRALHSAVLKKHIARKAKAAAAASSVAVAASASSLEVVAPAPPPSAFTSQPATATPVSLERRQANAVSFTNDGNQCAENCDKTTVLVDMDLENTSEEDSQSTGCADNCMQPYRNDSSPYYTPELWTPIKDESFDCTFNGSNYPSGGGLDDSSIPLPQPLNIPLVQSMYIAQNVSSIQPLVDRHQTSSNFEPISSTHRNKYSDRPNLIKLPVVPMRYEQQSTQNANIAKMYSSSETGVSTYTNSQSLRASSLIQINLQAGSSRDENNPIEMNEKKDTNHSHSKETLHKKQCPDSGADASDAENMDISSMIVVDEIDCTSPEPDITKSLNLSNSDSQCAPNILTNVPVPSSQYANRSKLPNNSPNTTPKIQNKPNQIQRQKLPSGNPFTLNNLRKENAFLIERKVSETGSGINVEIPIRSNFEVTRPNQRSFTSNRGLNNALPTANKDGPGRFVIHLGEDSDSEDEGQATNQQFCKLPKRTIVNEIALQRNPRLNTPASIPAEDNTSFSASLDAFFKQTRALYDLKHAKKKEALQLSGPLTSSGKHTVKELGTDEDLPNTSNFFNVRTVTSGRNAPVKESDAGPAQKRRRISITATETRCDTQYKLVEQGIGRQDSGTVVGKLECGTGIGRQDSKIVVGRSECGTVIGKPESGTVFGRLDSGMVSGRSECGTVIGKPECGTVFERLDSGMATGKSECGTVFGRLDSGTVTGRPECGSVFGRLDSGTVTGRSECGTVFGRLDSGMVTGKPECGSVFGRLDSGPVTGRLECGTVIGKPKCGAVFGRLDSGTVTGRAECGSVIKRQECGTETETRVATTSTIMVPGKCSIQNITVTIGNKTVNTLNAPVKKNKQRITFKTSPAQRVKVTNENPAPASGSKSDVHHAPKSIARPEMCGIGSTVAKPLSLNSTNSVKLVDTSTVLPIRSDKTASIQPYKPSSTALSVANENPLLTVADEKLASGAQALNPTLDLHRLATPLANGKPVKLVRVPSQQPVLSTVSQEIQVKNANTVTIVKNVEIIPQKAHDSRSNQVISENTNQAMDEKNLKLTESRLLRERSSLLLDLTYISDNLNDSSKYDQGIKESLETISQQKKIIELATRSLALARERIANDIKKKSQIFSLINNKRKIVASKRDVCLKLQNECKNLGSKIKGQSYMAPQYLESELSVKLKDVGAEISKSIKGVLPQQQKTNLPCGSTADSDNQSLPNNLESASIHKTDVSLDANHLHDAPSESVGENHGQILWLMDCPYERNGICGDVTECPFLHKKHR